MVTRSDNKKLNRREFLKHSAVTAAAFSAGLAAKPVYAAKKKRTSAAKARKVIILGIDGMDPNLSERLMDAGLLPNFNKLRKMGGYRRLGTSIPPQSPVAWANFITGAGPGTHGIFDFLHRRPEKPWETVQSSAETIPGEGYWRTGDHKLQLTFWPFNHTPSRTLLGRRGIPFWDYLDEAGIKSQVYQIPSNYPPSPSKCGFHRSISGLGTPDLLGTIGLHQYFSEHGPQSLTLVNNRGLQSRLVFRNQTAKGLLLGPENSFLKKPRRTDIEFKVHRDVQTHTVVIDIQDRKILLRQGQWSGWIELDFELAMPPFLPDKHISGICRFYLKQVTPDFQLYVSPININPLDAVTRISEPEKFVKQISDKLGLFYTIGFKEDYNARMNEIFTDAEYVVQTDMVLQERLKLLEYALEKYEDGVLFFYFSSTDLQAHIFWWDSYEKHPFRSQSQAEKYNNHIKELYKKMDGVLGNILKRYGDKATIFALSDHGFANFTRQLDLNVWLRDNGYIHASWRTENLKDIDWSKTKAYALGLNSLYLNLKGREHDGIVEPAQERETLLLELIAKLEGLRDANGWRVIRKVYRPDEVYTGPEVRFAADLIIGYYRGYRTSWATCMGDMSEKVLSDNNLAWSADHCFDPREVPGVLFCNKPIQAQGPNLMDLAPAILAEFGLNKPDTMEGKSIFVT